MTSPPGLLGGLAARAAALFRRAGRKDAQPRRVDPDAPRMSEGSPPRTSIDYDPDNRGGGVTGIP